MLFNYYNVDLLDFYIREI